MQVRLDEERTAVLCVRFGDGVPKRLSGHPTRRTTSVKISVKKDDELLGEVDGLAFCHPTDQFQKFEGRRRAMGRAFGQDTERTLLSKKDRRLIAKKILQCIRE